MCKFMKERLEESQNTFRDLVRRDLDKAPEGVNLQVGGVRSAVWTRACLSGLIAAMFCASTGSCLAAAAAERRPCADLGSHVLAVQPSLVCNPLCQLAHTPCSNTPAPAAE